MRTITEATKLVRSGRISPVRLTEECLETIERLNSSLRAFITVTSKSALAQAKQAEIEIRSDHWRGSLHGIPIALKDLIDTAGVRTTAGSAVFEDRVPVEDAEVVAKLKAAGAVIIGKNNLHEFAYGGSSLISHFGIARNPVNPEFIAGGSSGGSAAAVASGMCYAAIGTDTSGSIREPAALCGVVGLKPSYGLVSVRGIIPLSKSLDHAGPITRSVEDAAIVLDATADSRGMYQQSVQTKLPPFRLGLPRKYFFDDLDPEVTTSVESAIEQLKNSAASVREIELPIDEDRCLQSAEAYAYHRELLASHSGLYDPETLRRIRAGEHITESQYREALAELARSRAAIANVFADVDVLVMPTTPIPAPAVSGLMKDPALLRPAELVLLRNTRPVNVWGLPAISVPCGVTSQGLPIGLQIAGPPGGDAKVLQIAHAYELKSQE